MKKKIEIRNEDREALRFILSEFSSYGDEVKEMAAGSGFTGAKLIATAKRYEGIRFKGGTIHYLAPDHVKWNECCPGIANPRTGICERVPAAIAVSHRRKK